MSPETGERPRKFALARIGRIVTAIALLLAALWYYGPRALETVTYDAVLNAPVMAVNSPIGGSLLRPPPPPGTVIRAGATVAEIVDPQAASVVLEELATARTNADQTRLAFITEDAELARLAASLAEAAERHLVASRIAVDLRLAVADADLVAAQAEAERARQEHERSLRLATTDAISRHRHDETAAAERKAAANVDAARGTRDRLAAERVALQAGVYIGDDHNDVPYSRQRLDEVNLRRLEVQRRAAEHMAQRDALDVEMAAKRGRLEAFDRVVLTAPRDGIVWRNHVDSGAVTVSPGRLTSLIACADLLVTASLPTRNLEGFLPGSEARVRPVGSATWFPARIEQIRAMGMEEQADHFAASPPVTGDRRVVATLRLDDPIAVGEGARFCDVGRTVEVRIAGPTARRLAGWGDQVQAWLRHARDVGVAAFDRANPIRPATGAGHD